MTADSTPSTAANVQAATGAPQASRPAESSLRDLVTAVWRGGAGANDLETTAGTGARRLLHNLQRGVLDLLYPPRCPVSGEDLASAPNPWLSATALAALPILADPLCPRCGAPLAAGTTPQPHCRLCAPNAGAFQRGLCLWAYEGAGRDLILAFKFGGHRHLAGLLGEWLYAAGRARGLFTGVRWLAPVPGSQTLGGNLLAEDHAAALVEGLLAADERAPQALGLQALRPGLRKIRATAPQATLNLAERLAAPADSMRCGAANLQNEAVVVIDDVLTTLATAAEAARALTAAGAGEVRLLALARTL